LSSALHSAAGARKHFGALLVGYYDKDDCFWPVKSAPVSTRNTQHARSKKLRAEERSTCPFADLPSNKMAMGTGNHARRNARPILGKPKIVCQVKFAEWTRDGKLRQPVFLGLRQDKIRAS